MAKEKHSPDFVDNAPTDVDFNACTVASLYRGDLALDAPRADRAWASDIEGEKFMAERLTIHVHTTGDKNAPPAVMVGVNGQQVWFKRGSRIKNVPRAFVEVMARSQSTTYRTTQVSDPSADEQMRTLRTTSADYAFSVLHDPNPKGSAWLARVTGEGC